MASKAERLPSGSYRSRGEYKDKNGKRKQKSFTVKVKGGDWRAAAREAEMLARQWEANHPDDDTALTIQAAVSRYIDNRSAVCSPSTIRGYRSIERILLELVPQMQCRDVTPAQLQSIINQYAAGHTPKATRNVGSLLIAALREACPEKRFDASFPRFRAIERNIPTDDDVRALMAASEADMRLLIALAAVGTLRLGEACGLRYEDVYREHHTIRIRGVMVRDENNHWSYKDHPKTASSSRTILLPPELIDMIGTGTGFIFPGTPVSYSIRFRRLRDSLGLKCRYHDLRHYSASIMASIGIPTLYAKERGGWSSDGVLKSIYQNPLSDKSRGFADQTNGYFSKNLFRGTNVAR